MADLCEGGNEPPGSLKPTHKGPKSDQLAPGLTSTCLSKGERSSNQNGDLVWSTGQHDNSLAVINGFRNRISLSIVATPQIHHNDIPIKTSRSTDFLNITVFSAYTLHLSHVLPTNIPKSSEFQRYILVSCYTVVGMFMIESKRVCFEIQLSVHIVLEQWSSGLAEIGNGFLDSRLDDKSFSTE
ncbi:hypothetical protein ANN_08501 [Periplaneta americana]|uniref:Uncharacterized protein n=1 Tax=Periplaneta americana TaxID=6978 RepID=A0ABQ8T341_PERAM|nr:hypothetical protein ANN_08501 [Periplaneta americana]